MREMTLKEDLLNLYNGWYENNRQVIKEGKWNLVDRNILAHPEQDQLRGLNLITYLPDEVNRIIDAYLLPRLTGILGNAAWFVPPQGRHVTILDIIPHNSGVKASEIKRDLNGYDDSIKTLVGSFDQGIRVGLEGVFASPDGITIQGFPLDNGLANFRESLRNNLSSFGLVNLEKTKYKIETAHVALAKFTDKMDGGRLLEVVDTLRDLELGEFTAKELVLNISSRYDKVTTIEVVRKYWLTQN